MSYGYAEAVIRSQDPEKIQALVDRLKSLNRLLDATGQDSYLYEDFVVALPEVLEELAANLEVQNTGDMLLSKFNDPGVTSAITQHFRVKSLDCTHESLKTQVTVF